MSGFSFSIRLRMSSPRLPLGGRKPSCCSSRAVDSHASNAFVFSRAPFRSHFIANLCADAIKNCIIVSSVLTRSIAGQGSSPSRTSSRHFSAPATVFSFSTAFLLGAKLNTLLITLSSKSARMHCDMATPYTLKTPFSSLQPFGTFASANACSIFFFSGMITNFANFSWSEMKSATLAKAPSCPSSIHEVVSFGGNDTQSSQSFGL
mmetsp:Transcript_15772/g.31004  ORF Transcript_15772/g.31004 Transcript_15772/m.31004 type:complete len:206 (-) Transcript_15772:281-898(-)